MSLEDKILDQMHYIRSGSIYAMNREFVMKKLRYYSGVSIPYILPSKRIINIDDKNDLMLAKVKMNEK